MATIEITVKDGMVRMLLGGRLDAEGVVPLWPQAGAALEGNRALPVVVEAAGVEYCDGAGIAFLVDLLRRDRDPGAGVEVRGLAPDFARLLEQFDPRAFRAKALPAPRREGLLAGLGRMTAGFAADVQAQVSFIGEAGRAMMAALGQPQRVRWRDALAVAEQAGVNALPIVTLVAFLMGVIIAYQSAVAMRQFGAEVYVADLIGLSMLRELAPLLTAILLAGRSGAAFAAEIGTMRVNEEIDALTTFGFDPVPFLVLPRILAAVVVTPLLAVYADLISILGGALIMLTFRVPFVTYFSQVFSLVQMNDFLGGLFKCCVFGVVVAGIGCLRGLQTGKGAAAVGIATTRAVVSSLVLIVVVDGVFAVIYYHLGI